MVRDDEQVGGGAKCRVWVGEQARVDVTVRGEDGQAGNRLVKVTRQAAKGWVGWEEAVRRK
jgi:hypothetical protein